MWKGCNEYTFIWIFVVCCLNFFWHFQGHMIVLCLGFWGPTMLISTEAGQFIFFGIFTIFLFLSDNFFHWINDILVELWFAFPWWLRHYFIYWLTFIFYLLELAFLLDHIFIVFYFYSLISVHITFYLSNPFICVVRRMCTICSLSLHSVNCFSLFRNFQIL